LNTIINPILTQSITGTVLDPSNLTVPLISKVNFKYHFSTNKFYLLFKNITLATTATTSSLSIHNNLTFTSVLCIPAFTSARTKFQFQSIDSTLQQQFGDITSASIVSVGQNIDGFKDDYFQWKLINPNVSTVKLPTYYNDTVQFDLGIVTNTRINLIKFGFRGIYF
jgi:hypothetical protein